MHITLLGTGADHCIPAFRCTCDICSDARIKKGRHIRHNSAALIASDSSKKEFLLVDMPPQILTMLSKNKIDDSKINSVLITHRHEDHTLGLRYLFHGSERKGFRVDSPVQLYIPATALAGISRKLLSEKKESVFTSREGYYNITRVNDLTSFECGEWIITPVETGHLSVKDRESTGLESFGYIIKEKGGATFVYLLDAAVSLPVKTLALLETLKIDCLVGDCTYEKTTLNSGHMDIDSLINLKNKLNPSRTIASHISHMNLGYKKLKKRLKKHSIELAYDGMELRI